MQIMPTFAYLAPLALFFLIGQPRRRSSRR